VTAVGPHPADVQPDTILIVQPELTRYTARVVEHHRNPDGQLNGITRVQVVDPGRSFWRAGLLIDVPTTALRPPNGPWHPDCTCRWAPWDDERGWQLRARAADCPRHPTDPQN
jgi:hypothetical protein